MWGPGRTTRAPPGPGSLSMPKASHSRPIQSLTVRPASWASMHVHQDGGDLGPVGVQFQQAVAPGGQFGVDLQAAAASAGDEGVAAGRIGQGGIEIFVQFGIDRRGAVADRIQSPEPVGIPAVEGLTWAADEVGDLDADGLALADAVQAPDALLQQVRLQGQVEQDQVMGKLEVAPLAADLRAQQDLGPVLHRGKVGGGAVALDELHALMEDGGVDAGPAHQGLAQVEHRLGAGADEQHLGRAQGPEGWR